MKKTIVITGATGFLGKPLISSFLRDNYDVIAVVRDASDLPKNCISSLSNIQDYESISETISRSDIVFHLAGIVGVEACNSNLKNTIDVNILGTINILDAARYYNKPVIFASVANINDHSFYAISKSTAERFVMMYNKEHKTNFMPVRIFNVFGPGQDTKSGKLIVNSILRGLKGEPISVYGDGSQIMDFIYIDDVISYLHYSIKKINENDKKTYEIGTCVGLSILSAVKIIMTE